MSVDCLGFWRLGFRDYGFRFEGAHGGLVEGVKKVKEPEGNGRRERGSCQVVSFDVLAPVCLVYVFSTVLSLTSLMK